jgi:hypothetical protein
MDRQRYPNFKLAQRRRRASQRGGRRPAGRPLTFPVKVALASAATFGVAFFYDEAPDVAIDPIDQVRSLGREQAPPAGAYYPGCAAARAAGVAPIYEGEPGYREEMDGDGDGIACEPYPR